MSSLRLAVRTLTATPFISGVAVLSLALGIGANAAIFSLFDQMLLRPLPVQEPGRLVNLASPGPKSGSVSCGNAGGCEEVFSYPMFRDLQAADTGLELAAHVGFGANLAHGGETSSGSGLLVSGSYFPVLGLRPALGRLLGPDDDRDIGESFVAVLSHGYWQDRLGADPGVLNTTIIVNGHAMTIVGVAPRGFEGTTRGSRPDVFVPISMRGLMSPGFDGFENRLSYWAYLFGRLTAGTSLESAAARIGTVYGGILREVEGPLQSGSSEAALERFVSREMVLSEGQRGQSSMLREVRAPMVLLLSITGIVLLIACANIANLLLVRGAARDQEMAIRGSLGASRGQLLRQLLTESCVLAVAGGLASLVVAQVILGGLRALMPSDASASLSFGLSGTMVLFAGGLSLLTGFLFGMYPALNATRADLATALRAHAGQPSGARSAARFRTAMVVVQLAMSMALLTGAGLFIRSLVNVSRVDLGLETERMVTFGLSPELNGYEPEHNRALFLQVEEALAAVPGVDSVTAGLVPLLADSSWGSNVSVEGFEDGPDVDANARYNEVGPGYFRTLGIPLLAGREFTDADTDDAPRVAIVNEAFAAKFDLDGPRAIGKRMAIGGGDELNMEIVGVVQDSRYAAVKEDVPPVFFLPYRQNLAIGRINVYVRTRGDAEQVMRAVPAVIERLDPELPVESLRTLEAQVRDNTVGDRMITMLSAAFAGLATLLAAVGLYGVLAFTVAQRTREIGVRIALGADGRRVRGMVLRQVAGLVLVGGGVGIVAALLLGRAAGSLLYGLQGHDPVVIAAVVLGLTGVALGAGYVPARRASRIDPMRALRQD